MLLPKELESAYHIRWLGDSLKLLDQRFLPYEERYLVCRDEEEVAEAIRDMVVRGAPAIGIAAAYGFVLGVARGKDGREVSRSLRASRPTAVNLFWALDRMERRLAEAQRKGEDVEEALASEAISLHIEDVRSNLRMGENGSHLVPDGGAVLTHCNTGHLATGGYGTALGVLRSARRKGKRFRVLVDETRPLLQGARLTAWELERDGFEVTLICDSAAAFAMKNGMVEAVFVGADRIALNGDVANKIGTYGLALAARAHGVPFYVVAPTSTFDAGVASGDRIPIEERSPREVLTVGDRLLPLGVSAWNPAFDVTPAELVTAIVTERGVIERPSEPSVMAHLGLR